MAIKISGSTIIDDSRNVVNAGIVTATSFVGDITGTATTATNLADAANITTGTIASARLTGSYNIDVTGTASTASFATTSYGLSGSPTILVSSAGINTTSAPTNFYVSGTSANNVVALGNTDANTALDFSVGNDFSLTLTGSIVLQNPTGVTTGQGGIIYIQQDGTGSRTCGFGSHWDFPSATAPTLSTGANALDALVYSVRSSTSIVTASLIGIGTI
jgi:hypothetical protein